MTARIITFFAFVLIAAPASPQQTGSASFDSNGVQIQYVDKGRGVPVVLLHGFTGSYARHWEAPGVMDALQTAGYRVIAMDCRGHGQSGKPHDACASTVRRSRRCCARTTLNPTTTFGSAQLC